jgi:hypothetical protein
MALGFSSRLCDGNSWLNSDHAAGTCPTFEFRPGVRDLHGLRLTVRLKTYFWPTHWQKIQSGPGALTWVQMATVLRWIYFERLHLQDRFLLSLRVVTPEGTTTEETEGGKRQLVSTDQHLGRQGLIASRERLQQVEAIRRRAANAVEAARAGHMAGSRPSSRTSASVSPRSRRAKYVGMRELTSLTPCLDLNPSP